MTRKWLLIQVGVVALVAAIVVVLLVLSGHRARTVREAAYDLNGIAPVVTLKDGKQICEGPVQADGAFRQLVFWNSGTGSKALVSVHQGRTPHSPTLALGYLEAPTVPSGENLSTLTQTVTPTPDMSVCIKAVRGAMTLYGGQTQYLSNFSGATYGAPVIKHSKPEETLWMQAWSAQPQGIWRSLSLAFHRMALFRLSWLGAWTFWILLVGLFAGFPLLVLAIWLALKDEPAQRGDD